MIAMPPEVQYDRLMESTLRAYMRPMLRQTVAALGMDPTYIDNMTDEEVLEAARRYGEALAKTCPECGRPYDDEN